MALMMAVPTQAQIKFGLKGGLNVTNMSFSSDVIDQSNKEGFFFGPTVKFSVPIVGLGVDLAALYDQRDAKMDNKTISQRSINVPVNLRYGVGLGSVASVFLFAGPQVGFDVGETDFNWKDTSNYSLKKSNFSVNVGMGVSLLTHLQLTANYNIACGKTADVTLVKAASDALGQVAGTQSRSRNNSWQVGLAYFF